MKVKLLTLVRLTSVLIALKGVNVTEKELLSANQLRQKLRLLVPKQLILAVGATEF